VTASVFLRQNLSGAYVSPPSHPPGPGRRADANTKSSPLSFKFEFSFLHFGVVRFSSVELGGFPVEAQPGVRCADTAAMPAAGVLLLRADHLHHHRLR
jgi:hypothetical protein